MAPTTEGSDGDGQVTREMPRVEADAAVAAATGTTAGTGYTGAMPTDRDPFADHPEYFVGAAFVGGLVMAQILKRVRR